MLGGPRSPMRRFRLTAAQRRRPEQPLQATCDVGLFRRTPAVLEAGAGRRTLGEFDPSAVARAGLRLEAAALRPGHRPPARENTANPPGGPGVAGAVGDAVRGRDGPAAVPALARGVGVARAAAGGAAL